MTKELRALLDRMDKLKTETRSLVNADKMDEAHEKSQEIRELQKEIDVQRALEEEELDEKREGNPLNNDDKPEKRDITGTVEYRDAWFKVLTGREDELEDEQRSMMRKVIIENRSLSSGSDKDGGYTVPEDISREILKALMELNTIRNLVRVVPKTAPSGKYTVRTGVAGKLYNTAEKEQIKELKNMEFEQISYNVKKFAGFMPAPNELLDDSFINFKQEIIDWLSESSLVTENEEILYGTGGENGVEGIISSKKFNALTAPATGIDIKFLRKIKNSVIAGYRRNGVWVMNTQAFEEIANIKDGNGRDILAPDPREEDRFNLFGRPVLVYDEIKTEEDQTTHILFGDFKRGYFMFDRKKFEIKSTDVGGDAFLTDQMYFRGIERFDGKVVDKTAAVVVSGVKVGAE
ncbi:MULTISPECIES: phage major capsid protein [unclassified Paenibacillus]|uniref:phage major capsid protein n=1 Tax=unclassified Paenibacillus TaxID=185978 RepID=UPI0009CD0F0C|nr:MULTISPECIES: phage major capsid protein [unclassified Paenibacillus]SLJ98169.1 phage major capsid protein, HK97 family [Paenibacillus sp. RU5A]SOC66807.1 phage major capsid protein, HK97 family [Paenibacillus sp. RU26A]SOC70044.1 phage major capsid protein, HK97 family [Paenibacillus sp. RU5M]